MEKVNKVIEKYGDRLNQFKSAQSENWETVIFKAVDTLHDLENEGYLKTQNIKSALLDVLKEYDEGKLNMAIFETQKLLDENSNDKFILKYLRETLTILFAVKVDKNKKGGGF